MALAYTSVAIRTAFGAMRTFMGSQSHDERPPLFRTWGQLYAAVLIFLFLIIVLLYLFTIAFDEVSA